CHIGPPSMAVARLERDPVLGEFGLMRLQARCGRVDPGGDVDHYAQRTVGFGLIDRFGHGEAGIVAGGRVVSRHPPELRHHRMVWRNGLGVELSESLLDLCGIHLHRTLLFRWELPVAIVMSAVPPTRAWSKNRQSFGDPLEHT